MALKNCQSSFLYLHSQTPLPSSAILDDIFLDRSGIRTDNVQHNRRWRCSVGYCCVRNGFSDLRVARNSYNCACVDKVSVRSD